MSTLLHVIPQAVFLCDLLRSVHAGWVSGTEIGLRGPGGRVWSYRAIYIALTAVIEVVRSYDGIPQTVQSSFRLPQLAARILGGVVLAPIVEEWIFRAVLLAALDRRLSFLKPNLVQSSLVVLLHVPDLIVDSAPLTVGSQVLVDALYLGWMRHRRE